jgi:serine/threonine-protein kinase
MSPHQTIAHYRIISKLGAGGMGEVWRACDTKLNRDIAIKVLPDALADNPDRLARFKREAQVLAALNHPNIAAVYGVESRAIVMELVEGQTLAGPMPLSVALPILQQLMEALEYAHDKGVVHRDLKPANIKVTPEGRVKVLDFGLAKALTSEAAPADPRSSPTLTMQGTIAGTIMGTAAYMAPEQARGQNVDKRADIWAFGVVAYELLTGKLLFDAPTVTDTLAAVLTMPLDLSLVPERLRPLLQQCLQRDPRQRLRDIGDAALLMRETPAVVVQPVRRSRTVGILAIASALAALTFAGLWLRSSASLPLPLPYRFTLDTVGPILFSPNGRWMVNLAGGLRVRSLEAVDWRLLPGTEDAVDPFWSPDSSTLGFFSDGRLRSISINGTNARSLASAPEPRGGAWRGGISDGTILFATAHQMQTVDLRSGAVKTLALRFAEGQSPWIPVFCPEGDGFVYLLSDGAKRSLFRSSLSATETAGQQVVETAYPVTIARHPHTGRWHMFFVRTEATPGIANRTLMTAPIDARTGALAGDAAPLVDAMSNWVGSPYASFDVGANGVIYWRNTTPSLAVWHLRWFDRNGNVTGAVGEAAGYASLALSPDESKVAALRGYPDQHIWIYNLRSGTGARIASLSGSEGNPIWSPDGRTIYYVSQTNAGSRVIRQSVDTGGNPEVLFSAPEGRMVLGQAVTPDDRYLILTQINGSAPGVSIVRLDLSASAGARQPELLFAMREGASTLRIAPDGHSLVITTGGNIYACRYPPDGDSPRLVASFPRPVWPFFSRDGRVLYAVSSQALYSHPVETSTGGQMRLGERSLLFRVLHPARADANLGAVSRDGGRILVIAADESEETRLQVVTDWTSLLRP